MASRRVKRHAAAAPKPIKQQPLATAIAGQTLPQGSGEEIAYTSSAVYAKSIIQYNPDELVGKKGLAIYRKMMLDDQVKAAVYAKIMAVLSTGYEVDEPEVSDAETEGEVAKEMTDYVKFNLEDMEGSFDSKLFEMLTSVIFGFSVTERVLRLIEKGKWAGKIALKALKTRQPFGFDFETDAFGNLLPDGVLQNQRRLPAEKFIIHSYHKTFDNIYGDSDLRSAYEAWWRKSNANRFKMITLERYGEPLMVFSHSQRLSDTNKSELQKFGQNLQNRSVLILPQFITLDLKQGDPKIASAFIPVIQEEDVAIRVSLLMPGLIGMSGEQAIGSFARAVKEFDAFIWVIEELRNDLETLINEKVVKPIIDLNYEVSEGKYPVFKFREITADHKEAIFNLWLKAGGTFTKTRQDENKARELIEFPPLSDDTPVAGEQTGLPAFDENGNPIAPNLGGGTFPTPIMPGGGGGGNGANFFPFGKDSILTYKRAA